MVGILRKRISGFLAGATEIEPPAGSDHEEVIVKETSAPDTNVDGLCPTFVDVMCASTNELPAEQQRADSRHIRHCPHCQAELRESQELLDVIAANAAYLFETETESPQASLTIPTTRIPSATRWLPLAAALVVIVGLLGGLLRSPEVVEADEILARLAQHEQAASLDPWYVWSAEGAGLGIARRLDPHAFQDTTQVARTVDALLRQHGFALRDPFRVAAIRAWRAGLAQRHDRVTYRDGEIIVTITGRHALREVELIIDPAEFVVVSQRWIFPGVGRLECTRPKPNDASPTETETTSTPGARR
jgi:hypothetical protein